MLTTDEKIVEILLNEKTNNNNPLLQHFKISYPNNTIAQMSNTIFVGVADYESKENGFDFDKGTDLVDILVVTKKVDNKGNKKTDKQIYSESKKIIKTVMLEIRRILQKDDNVAILGGLPRFRNITPEYSPNYVLNRGHMMLQLNVIDDIFYDSESIERVCELLVENIEQE